MSGAGTRGSHRLQTNSTAIDPAESAIVARFAPGTASTTATSERMNP